MSDIPKWVEPDAVIPNERACADCANARRCRGLLGKSFRDESRWCDWSPHRFSLRDAK